MATQIRQIRDDERGVNVLRVEGDLLYEDAVLLRRIANELRHAEGKPVLIDLADLDFIDSEAAPIIRKLASQDGIELDGVEIFLQSLIDQAERS